MRWGGIYGILRSWNSLGEGGLKKERAEKEILAFKGAMVSTIRGLSVGGGAKDGEL